MIDKAGDNNKQLFTKHRNIWICGSKRHETKKNIGLLRFIKDNNRMDAEECEDVKGHDDAS